jgi:hypothetical protein
VDDGVDVVVLPFLFPFFGDQLATVVGVDSNGKLGFEFAPGFFSDFTPTLFELGTEWIVAGFWMDQTTFEPGQGVFIDLFANRAVFTWVTSSVVNPDARITFQVILYKTGAIRINIDSAGATFFDNFEGFWFAPLVGVGGGDQRNVWVHPNLVTSSWLFQPVPSIGLSPDEGPVGTSVSVSGADFPANALVDLTYDGAPLGSVTTNAVGSFSFAFTVRPSPLGPHVVLAINETSGLGAVAVFIVNPSIVLTSSSGPPGAPFTVIGTGFSADAFAAIGFEDLVLSLFVATDDVGNLSATVFVPLVAAGAYDVKATDGPSLIAATAPFSVIDVTPLEVGVESSAIRFRGEIAQFYVLLTFHGQRVDGTITSARLYGPANSVVVDLTASAVAIDTGLYAITHTIPTNAAVGDYRLVVDAAYSGAFIDSAGSGLDGFTISASLTDFGATLLAIEGDVAIIQTDIGIIKVDLAALRTDLGLVRTFSAETRNAVPILQVLLAVIVVLAIVSLVLAFTGRRKPPTSPEPPEPSEL